MNSQQEGILWIGLAVVLVFLFTDQSFRDMILNRGTYKTTSEVNEPYTLADITGIPSGSPNTGTVKAV